MGQMTEPYTYHGDNGTRITVAWRVADTPIVMLTVRADDPDGDGSEQTTAEVQISAEVARELAERLDAAAGRAEEVAEVERERDAVADGRFDETW